MLIDEVINEVEVVKTSIELGDVLDLTAIGGQEGEIVEMRRHSE